ncbi:hypothetical protein RHODOSMS8_00559 [Rhodobiaceae bacterium]|nr:hypothetical protein RHODOSMS8_00559 [Rhodobiaceae bacterium]
MSLSLRQGLTPGLLIVSIALLSSLIPGGPIENREFGHLGVAAVLTFNIFLAALILTSVFAVVLTWKRSHFGGGLAFLCSIGFAGVYLLDLLEIFPTSPTAMSAPLYYVESIGLIVAGLLMAASKPLKLSKRDARTARAQHRPFSLSVQTVFVVLAVTVGIVVFATVSALGV